MPIHDNLIHAILVPTMLPPSPRTGRPYTSASVYRWFNVGRLTPVQIGRDRGVYAFRAEVEQLAKEKTEQAEQREAVVA